MLHLFKKVYVATDHIIDVFTDRVVVSKEHGHKVSEDLDTLTSGVLIAHSFEVKNLLGSKNTAFIDSMDMFTTLGNRTDQTGKRIIIYCDGEAFKRIMSLWFNIIFKKTNTAAATDLLESMVFKHKIFGQARFVSNNGNTDNPYEIDIKNFGKIFDNSAKPSADERKKFITENKSSISMEFLLATYLANGKMKKELKSVLTMLIKKDLEKYLGELKETFFAHLLTKRFTSKLNLNKEYDFTNYDEILKDDSEFPTIFMNPDIWTTPYLAKPTAGKNIHFNNLTPKHIQSFAKFTVMMGESWDEANQLSFIDADISKLDFIEYIQGDEMTDKQLDAIIKVESEYKQSAGSFFSIDLETVNHYFVQAILDGNKDFREQYAIM